MTETFDLIAQQRLRFAQYLESLEDPEWDVASLCRGWTVRHVVTHLTMPFLVSTPKLVWRMVKAGGNFNRVANDFAQKKPEKSNEELIGLMREHAKDQFTPPGLGPEAPLTDIIIHGYDVALPTNHTIDVPAEASKRSLDFLVTPKATRGFVRPRMTKDLRFSCPELEWSAGQGSLVEGSARDLMLALTGRRIENSSLRGEGVASMQRRAAY